MAIKLNRQSAANDESRDKKLSQTMKWLSSFLQNFISWYASLTLAKQIVLNIAFFIVLVPILIGLGMLAVNIFLRVGGSRKK
jgi:hypothetical protein